jgi:hypothetical protein
VAAGRKSFFIWRPIGGGFGSKKARPAVDKWLSFFGPYQFDASFAMAFLWKSYNRRRTVAFVQKRRDSVQHSYDHPGEIRRMSRKPPPPLPVLSLGMIAISFAFPAFADTTPLVQPSTAAACASGEAMARIELVFGMSLPGGGMLSEAEWAAFIDAEVTPRFPDGLTVLTGYGQWRNSAGVIIRETSRMLVIWHKPATDLGGRVEAIRSAYKTRFSQESVLRVDGVSCVSF